MRIRVRGEGDSCPPGMYVAEIVEVKEAPGGPRPRIQWVVNFDCRGRTYRAIGFTDGEWGQDSREVAWLEAALGQGLGDGTEVELEDLSGLVVQARISPKKKDGKAFYDVEALYRK